ncbi:MAG: leucine-rich repeat protein, partial [Clostridia bacterium]|nr:leucine-rich repeat protein [Clostridia bacterium]
MYSVVFVNYDNSIITSQIVKEGDAATAPVAPRNRTGYTFSGWDTDFSNVTSDLTVKAQYKIITYTVTFVDDNGKIIKTQKVPYGSSATAPEPPIKEGLVFYGWNKEFDHVTEYITVTAIYQSPFIFILNEDEQSYSVKKNNNVQLIGNFVIPATYNDLPVTSIGEQAFYRCESLTSITIPDSVTSIGEQAFFSCRSLESITIPDSVTSIGKQAFSGCHSLTSITIPDSVTSIGQQTFSGCHSLTSMTIPDSVTFIDTWAFANCYSL